MHVIVDLMDIFNYANAGDDAWVPCHAGLDLHKARSWLLNNKCQ